MQGRGDCLISKATVMDLFCSLYLLLVCRDGLYKPVWCMTALGACAATLIILSRSRFGWCQCRISFDLLRFVHAQYSLLMGLPASTDYVSRAGSTGLDFV